MDPILMGISGILVGSIIGPVIVLIGLEFGWWDKIADWIISLMF